MLPGLLCFVGEMDRRAVCRSLIITDRLGWTRARLNELVRGKRGVTAEAALDLAQVLGTSPKLWMNLQATFDLDRVQRARNAA